MSPITNKGVSYIQAFSFLKTWGYKKTRGGWVHPSCPDMKIKNVYEAYSYAKKKLEETGGTR